MIWILLAASIVALVVLTYIGVDCFKCSKTLTKRSQCLIDNKRIK